MKFYQLKKSIIFELLLATFLIIIPSIVLGMEVNHEDEMNKACVLCKSPKLQGEQLELATSLNGPNSDIYKQLIHLNCGHAMHRICRTMILLDNRKECPECNHPIQIPQELADKIELATNLMNEIKEELRGIKHDLEVEMRYLELKRYCLRLKSKIQAAIQEAYEQIVNDSPSPLFLLLVLSIFFTMYNNYSPQNQGLS